MNLNKTLIYGAILGLALTIWTIINHEITTNSTPAIIMTGLFFGIYGIVAMAFLRIEKIKSVVKNIIHLIAIGAIGIGLLGAGYFINATFLNKNYVASEMEKSHEKWNTLDYSAAKVSQQIELTETFQTPLFWSFELIKFNSIIFIVVSTAVLALHILLTKGGANQPKIELETAGN
ncbi:hypothetical protein [Flexithrix dorotheae]|uniref:hypothetical protein n=1 Tax=Flexithrix dorotheae TaxID=70993 RepID=UPI0003A3FEF7|nr:hypothetical protein [Flexithrix dorotheae]